MSAHARGNARFSFARCILTCTAACLLSTGRAMGAPATAAPAAVAQPSATFRVPEKVLPLLDRYCLSCHDADEQKGKVRLDEMASLPAPARAELLNKIQEQIYFRQMPPKKKEQPADAELALLGAWISGELKNHGGSKLEDKLRYPAYGNAVDHQKLFSGEITTPAFTPARRWLVSPQIFTHRVLDVFGSEERNKSNLYGVTNPFVMPDGSGIRYYDNETLDGGTLLVMLTNVDWISRKQLWSARLKSGEITADQLTNKQDAWYPKVTPASFEAIVLSKTPPTDSQIADAIKTQFSLVLRRQPSPLEQASYLQLTRASIKDAGNSEGLRQMLIAVLMESEFLYRMEFGEGAPDSYGRKLLSPQEGAYALAYALGDRGPDAALLQAAQSGNLKSREDYRREVLRMLDDKTSFRGEIDPGLGGKNMRAHVSTHPRIVRFFRDFFGYPMATRVFKDPERGFGIYQNPDRGTAGTPGFLVNEADRIVDHILQADKDVFARLLTTDEYFVYYDKAPEQGRAIIAEWKQAWAALKDKPWKTEPDKVLAENQDFLKTLKHMRIPPDRNQKREFLRHMYFFSDYFDRGLTPFTTISTAHGYTYNHSPFYNLPPTPLRGRYDGAENPRFKGLDEALFWDYPVEQPFKIANRKGILTHPAWLIAHSQNTQSDPVIRGRWVREKLLAGRVPDVPINVDAVIPEDHHKTLRERLDKATASQECSKCHQYMNPLGLTFEVYDDFGRYRTQEALEHPENIISKKAGSVVYKTLPVNSAGVLDGTGEPGVDGSVGNALEMMDRLAKSVRVRQSFIRHAFRFFMGRNESLADSRTLIDADNAYVKSGGSFKAVIVSLLTSDSFLYRKAVTN